MSQSMQPSNRQQQTEPDTSTASREVHGTELVAPATPVINLEAEDTFVFDQPGAEIDPQTQLATAFAGLELRLAGAAARVELRIAAAAPSLDTQVKKLIKTALANPALALTANAGLESAMLRLANPNSSVDSSTPAVSPQQHGATNVIRRNISSCTEAAARIVTAAKTAIAAEITSGAITHQQAIAMVTAATRSEVDPQKILALTQIGAAIGEAQSIVEMADRFGISEPKLFRLYQCVAFSLPISNDNVPNSGAWKAFPSNRKAEAIEIVRERLGEIHDQTEEIGFRLFCSLRASLNSEIKE